MEWKTHCRKHSQHEQFIPVNDFSEVHLPNDLVTFSDKPKVCDLVRQQADLTVRICVRTAGTGHQTADTVSYPRPRGLWHLGSGWIHNVREAQRGEACLCSECKSNPVKSQRRWFVIEVKTAFHVVFDTQEAETIVVDLFYDDDSMPTKERGCVKSSISRTNWRRTRQLQCVALVSSDLHLDVTILKCVTHDDEIYHRLQSALGLLSRQADRLTQQVSNRKFGKRHFSEPSSAVARKVPHWCSPRQSIAVVVSHPHGLPKQVTIGTVQGKVLRNYFESDPQLCVREAGTQMSNEDSIKFSNRVRQLSLRDGHLDKRITKCALLKILAGEKQARCCRLPREDYVGRLRNCPNCVCFRDETRWEAGFEDTVDALLHIFNLSINDASHKLDENSLNGLEDVIPKQDMTQGGRNKSSFCQHSFSDYTKQHSVYSNAGKETADLNQDYESIVLQLKQFSQEVQRSRDGYLYMPVYNTPTCPGSSGAPVFIFPSDLSSSCTSNRSFRPRCEKHDVRNGNPKSFDGFHTHSTWKRADSCDMPSPTSSSKLNVRTPKPDSRCSGSCSCSDPPSQPRRKQSGNKKLEYQSSIDCPGPPSPPPVQGQERSSNSLLDGAFGVLNDVFKTLYAFLWPSSSNKRRSQGESDMDTIMVLVKFPKGETKFCDIYFNTRLVKEEKERLFNLMAEDYGSPDNYSLLLYCASNANSPITMDDEEEILMYCDEIADDSKLVFVPKQQEVLEIGPALGVSLKL